ncbi:MAG: transposase [SAR324 cluster bacterium]|nr:transposase [SAR324 cluster bacterium]
MSVLDKWPYIYVDAIYEKGRCNHRIHSMAVLIAKGV